MLLSIIIPVFNSEKHIANCLDSLLLKKLTFQYYSFQAF